jgi:RNA-directed DNA polymerase
MQQIADILSVSKKNKAYLQEYVYCGSNQLHKKSLQAYQKHQVNALAFLSLETPAELCRLLRVTFSQLEEIVNNPVYKHYAIKKKRGGERQIHSPEKELKAIQKKLNYFLQAYYLWIKPNEVFGFVINPRYLETYCNIAENAKPHTGKKHLLNVDLKDFFPSISAKRVKSVFTSSYFSFNEQIAAALTLLTTYEGKLPIGTPTSPVISNFVCIQLDADLKSFCQANGLQFTRYADDLTFSSDTLISNDNVLDIINLIKKNGFEVNEKKLRLKSSNRRQTVTGLTVNEKVNVDRKLLKKIRAMLHDWTTNGIDAATKRHFNLSSESDTKQRDKFIHRLEGYINFVGQVRGKDDSVYTKLKALF